VTSGSIRKPWFETRLSKIVNIAVPIIQAPMAGGITRPELVAAVSSSGGLGSLGAGMLPPERIAADISAIRRLTNAPFNVNLFVLAAPQVDTSSLEAAMALLQTFREDLGLPVAEPPARFCEDFSEQLETVLEERPPVVSFTFGIIDGAAVERLHRAGAKVIGTATHVAEALAWEAVGADAVCVQGAEAGGHRGTFLGPPEEAMIGTLALVPQVIDAVQIPVIAAGGIMDGRGIAAALVLGAAGAQLGTAFLACKESGIPEQWKERLKASKDTGTRVTRLFSGRPARGLVNEFMERLIHSVLPRLRDFRGVSAKAFDGRGNYTLGLKEQLIFPEIKYDSVQMVHGMDITVVTTAADDTAARDLLKRMGMPFREAR